MGNRKYRIYNSNAKQLGWTIARSCHYIWVATERRAWLYSERETARGIADYNTLPDDAQVL